MYKSIIFWLNIIITFYIELCCSQQLYRFQDDSCPLSNNQTGSCKLLNDCPVAKEELKDFNKYPIICSFRGIQPIVCCQTTTNVLVTRTNYLVGDPCILKNGNSGTCELLETCDFETNTIIADEWNWCSDSPRTNFICCHKKKPKYIIACNYYKLLFGDYELTNTVMVIYNSSNTDLSSEIDDYDDTALFEVGGEPAEYGEFPHMALIGFGTEDSKVWGCGGTLISDNFVLTAAHCIFLQDVGDAKFVRLGELDLSQQDNNMKPEDFDISETILHPDYRPPLIYNDIALLKLDRKVTITSLIHPACLYDKYTVPFSKLNATGWGATEYLGDLNNHLLKVELSLYTYEECFPHYSQQTNKRVLSYGIANDTQICSGGRGEYKDSCQGDSGGPLQMKNGTDAYYVVGVTSFGKACGIGTSPGVYTRVSAFVPWIESIVWS